MTEQITRVLKDIILLCKMSTVFLSIYAWLGKKFDDNWNKNGLGLHIYLNIDPENQNHSTLHFNCSTSDGKWYMPPTIRIYEILNKLLW